MFYETETNDHGLPRDPFKSCVVPRPIGWISTLNADGVANLAPFSYFNAVSGVPPHVMFSPGGVGPEGAGTAPILGRLGLQSLLVSSLSSLTAYFAS